jgi:hypothetical protein
VRRIGYAPHLNLLAVAKTYGIENTGNTAFFAQCWDAMEHSGTLWNGELVRADGIEPPTFAL